MPHRTWAEVNLSHIIHNYEQIKRATGPGVKVLAAVKANAYGHGAVPVSRALAEAGVDMLGIAALSEAIELREAGLRLPMLLFGCVLPDGIGEALEHAVSLTVCDTDLADDVSEAARRLGRAASVHVKIDTGMGRIGVRHDEALELIRHVSALEAVSLDGIWTHFPAADETDVSFAHEQLALFGAVVEAMEADGIPVPLRHAANSGAIAQIPEAHLDMVRPGLALYGYHPTADRVLPLDLRPGMTLKTRISFVKKLPTGASVSYGRTFVTRRPTRAATLPVGYADGFNRLRSNEGEVLVRGRRAPIIGRICMDQCVVDVTDVPEAQLGDEVVLYGTQGAETISVESVAKALGTIPNEVVCAVGARVPRVHIR